MTSHLKLDDIKNTGRLKGHLDLSLLEESMPIEKVIHISSFTYSVIKPSKCFGFCLRFKITVSKRRNCGA